MAYSCLPSLFSVKSVSWDTHQRLPYNPHRTPTPKKPNKTPNTLTLTTTSTTSPIVESSISTLLSRNSQTPFQVRNWRKLIWVRSDSVVVCVYMYVVCHGLTGFLCEKLEETYLGYERWLPSPPKVEKPRSIYNAASLAYIGDCIYELYARRHFLFPPLNIEEYNDRVMAVVRCEAQDAMLQKLLNENCLTQEERDVLRWGKNIGSAKTRTKKRAGVAVYNRASSLETLIGYLYLTNVKRLEEIMLKLGFSCDASPKLTLEQANGPTMMILDEDRDLNSGLFYELTSLIFSVSYRKKPLIKTSKVHFVQK
ncbi:unnamed protein product [Camellia sinensis]